MTPGRRRLAAVAAVLLVIAVVLFAARDAVAAFVVSRIIAASTGYDVRFGTLQLGAAHGVARDVHVTKNGDPVLDADRVDIDYALRDIFPGGDHRFGFVSAAVDRAVITIVRHNDGFSFNRGGTPAAPPSSTKAAVAPYFFTLRLRHGTVRLADTAPLSPDLAYQTVDDVTLDASVKSDSRTTAQFDGVLIGARAQGAPVVRWPLHERTIIDRARGIASHHVFAPALPLRGMMGFFLHQPIARFDDGILRAIDVRAYAVNIPVDGAFPYRYGGTMQLDGGRLAVRPLARPIRDLHGVLDVCDDGIVLPRIDGAAGALPLRARGGLYGLLGGEPQFRIALTSDGDLRELRRLFAFSEREPVRGAAHLETLLEAGIAKPLIRSVLVAPRVAYDRYPLHDVDVLVDYYDGLVSVGDARAGFGALSTVIGGTIDVSAPETTLALVGTASGPARAIPYAQLVGGDGAVALDALIGGTPKAGYTARGAVRLAGTTSGAGFFAVDERGRGEFGPFALARAGGTLIGALRLDRPVSQSAAWIDAQGFPLDAPSLTAQLPGVPPPGLPPLSGIVDAHVAGGGSPDAFAIAGAVHASHAVVAEKELGDVRAQLGGSLADLTLRDIRVDGPFGRFSGSGDARDGVFATRGRFDGPLAPIAALAGRRDARGEAHGDVAATIAKNRLLIQAAGTRLDGAEIAGVRGLASADGTIALEGKRYDTVRIYAARAGLRDGDAVAAGGAAHGFLVAAPGVQAADLAGTGVPLQSGTIDILGVTDVTAGMPSFDGGVIVRDARAMGRRVAGAADVHLARGSADVRGATVALGTTFGDVAGRIDGIGAHELTYDFGARVPYGDVGVLRRDLALPPQLRTLVGSFDADVRVTGAGARPRASGGLVVPEGAFNGLAFRNGRAHIDVSPSSLAARAGQITVGSTTATVDASYAAGAYTLRAASTRADLADFNDYFDDADVLAGTGRFAVALLSDPGRTATTGRLDLRDVRYRRFPLGATRASWSSAGNLVRGEARVDGSAGAMTAAGSMATAHGSLLQAFAGARYDLRLTADRLALGTWLPAAGINVPVFGDVDGNASVRGRFPQLAIDSDLSLHDGVVAGYRVVAASARTRSTGNGRINLESATADLGFAVTSASGSFGLGPGAPLALRAHATALDLGVALKRIAPQVPLDVGGAVDIDARIAGTLRSPQLDAGFDIESGRYASLPIPRIVGSVALNDHHVTLREAEVTLQRGSALVAGSLPLEVFPLAIGPATSPLSFDVQARGVDLAPFSSLVPVAGTKLGGTLDGRIGVEGTVRAPRVLGAMNLTGGSYVSSFETAPITNVTARLAFGGTSVALDAFHAAVGGGSLDGSGRLDLPIPGAPRGGYSITLVAKGDRLNFPQYGSGRVDGQLALSSGPQRPLLSGNVTVTDGTIPFAAIYRTGAGGGAAAVAAAPPLDLGFDVHATAGRNVRVRAPFLDVAAAGTADLTGTLASPRLAGTFTAAPGGFFTTYNHVFRVQSGIVTFDPTAGIVPNIDMRATAHVVNPDPDPARNTVGSADITVTVTGPADGFSVAYSSEPPYSTDEIVALLSDIPALLGSVRFGRGSSAALLPGAPVPENPLDPPGVTLTTQAAALNFNEEAFSLLNAQLAQRLLGPLERIFGGVFGLTDFQITLDYGGGVGYNARQRLGHREVYANIGQVLTYPGRTQIGIDAEPNNATSVLVGYYSQSGVTSFTNNGYATTTKEVANLRRLNGLQPLGNRSGITVTITRRFR